MSMQFRDRIKEFRRVSAGELRPNPRNWRLHPPAQAAALRGMLGEVGYADALLARELADGTLELVDGHLRAEVSATQIVPVLILDVSEAEALQVMTTLDPLAALAETDQQRLKALLTEVQIDDEAVRTMLDGLLDETNSARGENAEGVDVGESYQLVIECDGEVQQRQLYDRLSSEGYTCRVVTL